MSQFVQEKKIFEKNHEDIEKRRFKREKEMEEERRNMNSLKFKAARSTGGGNFSRGGGYNRNRGNFGTF